MFLGKNAMPKEDEIVLCTVTKIYGHAVFVNLDEFQRSGMIHISEISPGRIRNIRDYVTEGKKIICKVLRIDFQKGHIDLSLRRVTEREKRDKSDAMKRQQKSEKIIEQIAKQNKILPQDLYRKIEDAVKDDYSNISEYFEDIANGNIDVAKIGLNPVVASNLTELIKTRIKPPIVNISGELSMSSYASNGVELIKTALVKGIEAVKGEIEIFYLGAGKYKLSVESADYKEAEKILSTALDTINANLPKGKCETEFKRVGK